MNPEYWTYLPDSSWIDFTNAENMDENYLKWLIFMADDDSFMLADNYCVLMHLLHNREFYCMDLTKQLKLMDQNRVDDAWQLRLLYEEETGETCTEDHPPSVLEVLVALCLKICRTVSYEGKESTSAHWFKVLINNLQLSGFTDDEFISNYNYEGEFELSVDDILISFLDRSYDPHGRPYGCLFPNDETTRDLRTVDIWMQWQLWAASNL